MIIPNLRLLSLSAFFIGCSGLASSVSSRMNAAPASDINRKDDYGYLTIIDNRPILQACKENDPTLLKQEMEDSKISPNAVVRSATVDQHPKSLMAYLIEHSPRLARELLKHEGFNTENFDVCPYTEIQISFLEEALRSIQEQEMKTRIGFLGFEKEEADNIDSMAERAQLALELIDKDGYEIHKKIDFQNLFCVPTSVFDFEVEQDEIWRLKALDKLIQRGACYNNHFVYRHTQKELQDGETYFKGRTLGNFIKMLTYNDEKGHPLLDIAASNNNKKFCKQLQNFTNVALPIETMLGWNINKVIDHQLMEESIDPRSLPEDIRYLIGRYACFWNPSKKTREYFKENNI